MAANITNNAPREDNENKNSPYQLICDTEIEINWSHWHTFGAPTYTLNENLQQEPRIQDKWLPRTNIQPSIYLGHSLQHARSIGLVLNPRTGLTSPQFHIQVDDNFDTVNKSDNKKSQQWLYLCGFKRNTKISKTPTENSTKNSTKSDLNENISEIRNAEKSPLPVE